MIINRLGRHCKEALRNLVRNGWMTFASVSSVAITLLILGVTIVIALNAQQVSKYVSNQLQISVILKQNVTDTEGQQVRNQIAGLPGVKSALFVSKEQGLKKMEKEMSSQYKGLLSGVSSDVLPDKVIVQAINPRQTAQVSSRIISISGVDHVDDGHILVAHIFKVLDVIRDIGISFVVALVLTAMFLISNTIKITIFSRRREIEIMKLVGATNWFIRWPFLMEGIMIGLIGALLPYALLIGGYHYTLGASGASFLPFRLTLVTTLDLAVKLGFVLFGLGLFIGVWGGIMSVRKFLRV